MIWFLVGIGATFFYVGQTSEAIVLFAAILPLLLMDAVLHYRTQASTSSLKNLLSSHVKVLRDGHTHIIRAEEIVPGDLALISSGDYIPADGIFEKVDGLQIDESVLTGEAFPVTKQATSLNVFSFSNGAEQLIDTKFLGYAGTRLLSGSCQLRVLFTGRATSYGEIVASVADILQERTPLQKSITHLVQILIFAAGVLCLILAAVRIYRGFGWLDAILSSATLAVAAIPEEFPVVFTFFLGVGVHRLAKRHALVRRAVSVENIGRVSYICTDKTGTITLGQLKLTHLDLAPGLSEQDILRAATGASDHLGSDPVDQAIYELARSKGLSKIKRIQVFPFTEDKKREAAFVTDVDGSSFCYVKGSPEVILSKSNLSEGEQRKWIEKTSKWAREGHKVLACGKRPLSIQELNENKEPLDGFVFCGLLAFEDPPRREVALAMDYCRENKIGVLMITGDHPDTAIAIAKEVRLGGDSPIVVNAETEAEKFKEDWLSANPNFLSSLNIVARCSPLQKLNIVNALRQSGELVAVTGDGVNDVPALKAADIGIAMGERGTKSAKEVSSIILADDNFSTIVNAIMEGRQLFTNLKMSFEYLLLIHFPLVLTAALIPFMGFPLLYLPIHIVWLELVIHPTALFAFQMEVEHRSKITLQERDKHHSKWFFTKRDSFRIAGVGLVLTIMLSLIYLGVFHSFVNDDHSRTKALFFLTLWSATVVGYLTGWRNWASRIISGATILTSIILIQVTPFAKSMHLSALSFTDYLYVILAMLVCLGVLIAVERSSVKY